MRPFNRYPIVFLVLLTNILMAQETDIGNYYGDRFTIDASKEGMGPIFNGLALSDSVRTQFTGKIKEVCQAKGCWMNVVLDSGEEVFVRFKDYGFFVPKDAADKMVYLNGLAFLEEMSVTEQKHYAKDSGSTEEEIQEITEPVRILRFEADGVFIKN